MSKAITVRTGNGELQLKRISKVTNTVTPLRIRLFQSTQRPAYTDGSQWIETEWGRCRIKGRLGQRHADVLEALLYTYLYTWPRDDGGALVIVDPYQVRHTLSDAGYSHARLTRLLDDLIEAVIQIDAPGLECKGHLVDYVSKCVWTAPNPRGGERHLWIVKLSMPLIYLIRNDLRLNHNPAPISRLQFGISQAIARHVLTHSIGRQPAGGWIVDNLIKAVAGELSSKQLRDRRHDLRRDADSLRALGIHIDGNRVRRVKRESDTKRISAVVPEKA